MPVRQRGATENNFENTEVEELIAMLRETENLEEQVLFEPLSIRKKQIIIYQ